MEETYTKTKSDITKTYFKTRKNFGRQPMFSLVRTEMLDSIEPNVSEQKVYSLRNPVNQGTQTVISQQEHYINTKHFKFQNSGVNHTEGGWPKDINFADDEATSRYRRRFERDDTYVDVVLDGYPKFDHFIKQNNAIEIYEMYFKGMRVEEPVEKSTVKLINVYKDPNKRPISCIDWTFEDDPKLAVAYCSSKYPVTGLLNSNLVCYVWDLEDPYIPYSEFLPPSACWQIACSPASCKIILGGLDDGRVCIFDIRAQKTPVGISPMHLAHRDPVSALLCIQSRSNTDFFSGSTDGKCMWWDMRDLSTPSEILIIAAQATPGAPVSLGNTDSIRALQFDRSFPTKFLCGTDTGFVINVNRKGKTSQEIFSATYHAHKGPVKAIHRSPCTTKVFITCGDWTVNIWSDDITSSPIISGTSQRYKINDVVWTPQRASGYMSVGDDGKFRYWDLLRKYHSPIIELPLSKQPLLKIKVHDEGQLVAVADIEGSIHLLTLSENLVLSGKRDKQIMIQTYEREIRREHTLETRIKEIRLKLKAEGVQVDKNDEESLTKTDEEYRRIVSDEMRRASFSEHGASRKIRAR